MDMDINRDIPHIHYIVSTLARQNLVLEFNYIRLMAHGHSLTTHQMFVYIYHSKTKEFLFTTHPLDIAYYILMHHITL
jgi:hypothetical protein